MPSWSLAFAALLMGLAGGPHCVAMCGAACAGLGRGPRGMALFHLGRLGGYAAAGALAGLSLQGVGWLATQAPALRPVWALWHGATLALGLALLWRAQQPLWLAGFGRSVWARVRGAGGGLRPGAALAAGVLWALMPCGLLYAALLLAALGGGAPEGAVLMALFALGSAGPLLLGPLLWLRLREGAGLGAWGARLAGLALAGSSAWALWHALAHDAAPWCVV